MRKVLLLSLAALMLAATALAHSGGTDANGGHWDYDTGKYHYHHGYPAHQHYDMNGDGIKDCPYEFDVRTSISSSGGSSGSSSSGSYGSFTTKATGSKAKGELIIYLVNAYKYGEGRLELTVEEIEEAGLNMQSVLDNPNLTENDINDYLIGHGVGYEYGYKDGRARGETVGWKKGYADGWKKGYAKAEAEHYEKGYDDGYKCATAEAEKAAAEVQAEFQEKLETERSQHNDRQFLAIIISVAGSVSVTFFLCKKPWKKENSRDDMSEQNKNNVFAQKRCKALRDRSKQSPKASIGMDLNIQGITATQESSLQTEDKESGTAPQTGIKNKIRRIWGWFVPPILATIYGLVAQGNLFSDGTDRLSGALLLCLLSIFITALASPVILALIGICKCIIRKIKQ